MTSMNTHRTSFRGWKSATLAVAIGLTALSAFPADPSPEPPAAPATESPTVEHRQRLDQVVMIGGDGKVLANQVAEQVVVIGGDALIEGDVRGDVVVVLGKLHLTGRVRGDVVVVLGEADIQGLIEGDLVMPLTRGRIGAPAEVKGDMLAVGVNPEVDPAAKMHGEPEIVSLGPIMRYLEWGRDYLLQGVLMLRPFPPRLGWVWVVAGLFLVFHLFLALVLGSAVRGCVTTLRDQPARSFLIGLLACVLVGPISLLLSFTMVATPLIWLAFFALCVFARVAVYAAAGSGFGRAIGFQGLDHPLPAVLVGSLFFYLSYMIPVLGFVVYWLVLPWGVGAALIRLTEALRRERPPGRPSIPRPAPGLSGSVAAASNLAAGGPGPATHATVPGSDAADVPPTVGAPAAEPPPVSSMPPPRSSTGFAPFGDMDLLAAPRAGFWPRCGAAFIDLILIAFINAMTFGEVRSFWLLLGLYHAVMWGWKGSTLGGAALGLRLVRLDGRPVDWQTAIVRMLGSVVSLLPLGLGFFWVSWDDENQSWHDRIAGTTIVRAERRAALV